MFFCEETYSLAILLKEMDLLCKSRLYATDISTTLDKSKKRNLLLMTLKNIPLITFHVGKRVSESIFCF
jgi:chemotaxis methyl-accepting protein methylase